MAYKGMNRKIKDALITILSGITYDSGSGQQSAFAHVTDNTSLAFDGYPSVRLLPNTLKSVTETNMSRNHTVSFAAIVHWELEEAGSIESDLYDQMYDITDLVTDTLEHGDFTNELSQIDPTVVNWWMNVTDTRWYVGSGKAGALLLCNINIEVTYSRSVN